MPTLSTHATLTKEQELHWLALKMTSGLGTRTAYQLIQKNYPAILRRRGLQ
jgi:hypothetical protein